MNYNLSQFFVARFTIQKNLETLSGLEFDRAMIKVIKAGLATVTMITVGDYCSVTPGVLHEFSPSRTSSLSSTLRVGFLPGKVWTLGSLLLLGSWFRCQ